MSHRRGANEIDGMSGMRTAVNRRWSLKQRIDFAHATTVCLGLGLLLLSLAPLLINRMIADVQPDLGDWVTKSATMLLAVTFLTLSVLIRNRWTWAVWTAFIVSTLMVASGIAVNVILGAHSGSAFVLVLSAATCFGSWRAIESIHEVGSEQSSTDPSLS